MSPQRFKCSECTNWTVESPDKSICDECLGRMAISGSGTTISRKSYEQSIADSLNAPVPPPTERSLRRDIMNLNSEKHRVEAAWVALTILDWTRLGNHTGRSAQEWSNLSAEIEAYWNTLK